MFHSEVLTLSPNLQVKEHPLLAVSDYWQLPFRAYCDEPSDSINASNFFTI